MTGIFQTLINGVICGAFYALIGCGLSLIWGTLNMINCAQGDLYMLGGYFMHIFLSLMGMHVVASILLSMLMVFIISLMIETSIINPMLDKPGWERTPFVLTLGVSIFIQNFAQHVWGERYKSVPYFSNRILNFRGVTLIEHRLIIVIVTIITIILLVFFIKKTKLGWAIRATSQNKFAASLIGINIKRIYLVTFAFSGALAALASALLSPVYGVNPWVGTMVQTKGMVVCVLGGLGSLEGAIVGGIIVGLIENLYVHWFPSEWKDVIAYLVLIMVLWIKPRGIFGRKVS